MLPNETVTLDGSSSNHPGAPDQSIVYCEWIQTQGDLVALDDNESCTTTTFTAPSSDQVLKFQLTVYDADGDSDSDEVIITVGVEVVPGCTDEMHIIIIRMQQLTMDLVLMFPLEQQLLQRYKTIIVAMKVSLLV